MKRFAPISTVLCSLLVVSLAHAQTTAVPASGGKGLTFSAKRQQVRASGVRLDGDARVVSPGELDAAANTIVLDADDKGLKEVRAIGNVRLKVDVPARAGGTPVHIETTSREATLDPRNKVLVLTGNVAGFYQPKGGARAMLGGEKVTLRFKEKDVSATVESGKLPVSISVPLPDAGALAGLGSVTVTAKTASLNETSDSLFSGGARAFSTGARKFEVTADSFAVKRGADGALDTLRTTGRTLLKTDLPAGTPDAGTLGAPVQFEVSSDSALVKRADNTLTFEGNVKGSYVLQNAAGVRTSYPFSGDRAVLTLVPGTATTKADFALDFSGAPTTIQAPRFDLGL